MFGWAALEGLQFALALALYFPTQSADAWYGWTLYVYLGIPLLLLLLLLLLVYYYYYNYYYYHYHYYYYDYYCHHHHYYNN